MKDQVEGRPATLLVATDLSEPADEAIRQADDWAEKVGARLVVCHVIPTRHRANPLFPQRNEVDALASVDLEQRVADLVRTRVADLTGRAPDSYRLVIDIGRPDAGIVEAAAAGGVSMIVIGSRGDTGLKRVLLGGVSERVVQYADCSVLVARPTAKRGAVLAATDLSDASFPAVKAGAVQARLRGARLTVLHNLDMWPPPVSSAGLALAAAGMPTDPAVVEEQCTAALKQLQETLARLNVDAECRVTTGAPDVAIVRVADDIEPELLVIGTHGRTGLSRLALGSVAERVVKMANCSVLVVRAGAT